MQERMTKPIIIKVVEGLILRKDKNGIWFMFTDEDGKNAMVNLSCFGASIQRVILGWANSFIMESQIEEK